MRLLPRRENILILHLDDHNQIWIFYQPPRNHRGTRPNDLKLFDLIVPILAIILSIYIQWALSTLSTAQLVVSRKASLRPQKTYTNVSFSERGSEYMPRSSNPNILSMIPESLRYDTYLHPHSSQSSRHTTSGSYRTLSHQPTSHWNPSSEELNPHVRMPCTFFMC